MITLNFQKGLKSKDIAQLDRLGIKTTQLAANKFKIEIPEDIPSLKLERDMTCNETLYYNGEKVAFFQGHVLSARSPLLFAGNSIGDIVYEGAYVYPEKIDKALGKPQPITPPKETKCLPCCAVM